MGKVTLAADKVKVFRRDKEYNGGTFATYSIGISSKDKDGNWVNGYLDVQFKKGVELQNKAEIEIKNAFPTLRESNGKVYTTWFIMDFVELSQGEPKRVDDLPIDGGFMNIPEGVDKDLPFAQPTRG